jgi:hypothetical protein
MRESSDGGMEFGTEYLKGRDDDDDGSIECGRYQH